jgi:hypothetical protein
MELEISLPCLQEFPTRLYPEDSHLEDLFLALHLYGYKSDLQC